MLNRQIYLDGQFLPQSEAKVSVFDHGFLYGDGVFEGIRAYSGRVFKLAEHVHRLYESAHTLLLQIPLTPEEMQEAILETCRRNQLTDAYIRVVVSRGAGDLGLDPRKCPKPTVVIIADTIQLYPQTVYETGMRIGTVSTRRNSAETVNPRIKSLNYLNNILARIEANLAGYAEVIMLSAEGYVVECTGDNIFIVKNGRLLTPPKHLGILEGITRRTVLELAHGLGIPVAEEIFTRHDVFTAEECFLTGTAAELVAVVEVDGRRVGEGKPGPVTRQLAEAFRHLARTTGTPIFLDPPVMASAGGD